MLVVTGLFTALDVLRLKLALYAILETNTLAIVIAYCLLAFALLFTSGEYLNLKAHRTIETC